MDGRCLTVSIVNIPYVLNLLLYIHFIILIYFLGDISISLAILNSSLNKGFVVVVVVQASWLTDTKGKGSFYITLFKTHS